MLKKLLMSGLVLGSLAALVGGASFAAFTDSETATGTVTAGTVDIDTIANFTFAPGDAGCPSPIGYLDSCEATATVDYVGNLNADLDFSLSDSSACFSSSGVVNPGGIPVAAGDEVSNTAAATFTVAITTQLIDDDISCQGVTNTVTLTVAAEEA